ncbi:MAG: MXAN_5187 C-terminal domain-containing protein [Sandaracinaceae bacterium]
MDLREFDSLLHDAEVKFKRLRALYEQWFQGIERTEPHIPRKDLDRLLMLLRKEKPRNTAARFRLQQLQARYNTYSTYWQRIARQIEEGTYAKDRMRVRRRRQRQAESEAPPVKTFELTEEGGGAPAPWPAPSPAAAAASADDDIASILSNIGPVPSERPRPRAMFTSFAPLMTGAKGPGAAPRAQESANPRARYSSRPPSPAATELAAALGARSGGAAKAPKVAAPEIPGGKVSPGARASAAAVAKASSRPPAPARMSKVPPAERGTAAGAAKVPREARRSYAPPPAQPGPHSARAARGRLDEPALRRLYQDYVDARRRNNERVDNVRFESMAKNVQKNAERLRAKHGGKDVGFEVVVRNGKVGLKPKIG